MIKTLFLSLTLLIVMLMTAVYFGIQNENADTAGLVRQMESSARQENRTVDFTRLNKLPAPVQRYFKTVLTDGQPMIERAVLEQTGRLKITPETAEWSKFAADQTVSATTPGFVWDARVLIAPLIHVRVRDAYINSEASGKVSLMSLILMGKESSRPKLDSGALFRYLAEAVWYPTALLPESGVTWEGIDETRAIATLKDGENTVSLEFRFNDMGEVTGIYTQKRYGLFDGAYEQHPWEGKFSHYEWHNGFKIPTQAEVGWHLPKGWWLFWQGTVRRIIFEYGK